MAKGDIKEVNGFKYSREEFEGYQYRTKIEIIAGDKYNFDFYTTNTNKETAFLHILDFITARTVSVKMVVWSSKEQDDKVGELINETMGYWERQEESRLQAQMDNQSTVDWYTHGSY